MSLLVSIELLKYWRFGAGTLSFSVLSIEHFLSFLCAIAFWAMGPFGPWTHILLFPMFSFSVSQIFSSAETHFQCHPIACRWSKSCVDGP
ncbi:MAG: hypothetical protein BYD32DRAFT_415336 [Podila humilis]|nr:MAG: hypothetical protein BYD32DRAFT_415336 [Podila humilis]